MNQNTKKGPLSHIKLIEMAGLGPCPMCAMLLAELGATVIRIDRKSPIDLGIKRPIEYDLLRRSRPAIGLDLKNPKAVELVLKLVASSDGLIEGFRPGVMEKMGLGPDVCMQRNPKFVFGRITGWGQDGPLAQEAAHDLNYIALTGVLNALGQRNGPPAIPLNLIGDFGGGALYLAMGVLAALMNAQVSGKGQVVDSAIVDGVSSLATMFYGFKAAGMWRDVRGTNTIDSGSYFCNVYQCSDDSWVSISSVEGRFNQIMLKKIGIDLSTCGEQMDPNLWPAMKEKLQAIFKTKTRNEWCAVFEGSDSCFAPVLSFDEVAQNPHMQHRKTIININGIDQPAPAPRFSRTPLGEPTPPMPINAQNTWDTLGQWMEPEQLEQYVNQGVIEAI